ncbi:MAG: SPOR domain-containing protein [Desulfuromonadaceae bacterium]|nr:SPOR domain-containing protein [Desulfuromonas sp.]MDY0184790.1 SPOR domain-containing protein [Desulfuromonadaceae bacterium]
MAQAEYKRAPRTSGRRKSMVLTFMVLLLCLACFALGVLVGGSGSKPLDAKDKLVNATSADAPAAVPATVRVSPAAQPEENQVLKATAQRAPTKLGLGGTVEREAAVQAESMEAAAREVVAERVAAAVEDALIEKPVTRETPLGSGINLRKKSEVSADFAADVVGSKASIPAANAVSASAALQDRSGKSAVGGATPPPLEATPKGGKGGAYVVQLASFRRDVDAQHLAQKLKADFPVYVRQVDLADKGQWFRVLAGPVTERAEADMLKQKMKERAGIEGFVKKHSEI